MGTTTTIAISIILLTICRARRDDWFLSRYRQMKIVLGSSDWDMCLDANVKMSAILHGKGVPHWLDIYGDEQQA
jgi:esterase/lipase superfamily enzyme